jgi:hypothetical protein
MNFCYTTLVFWRVRVNVLEEELVAVSVSIDVAVGLTAFAVC